MTRKERQQIQIVGLAVAGDTDRATALIAEHLAEFPDDELIGLVQAWLVRPPADDGGAQNKRLGGGCARRHPGRRR